MAISARARNSILEGIFYLVNKEHEMRVAVAQMNSGEDKTQNLSTAERLLIEAAERGAELAVLPELFTYLGRRGKHREVADAIPGATSELLTRIARRHHLHIVGGSFL